MNVPKGEAIIPNYRGLCLKSVETEAPVAVGSRCRLFVRRGDGESWLGEDHGWGGMTATAKNKKQWSNKEQETNKHAAKQRHMIYIYI